MKKLTLLALLISGCAVENADLTIETLRKQGYVDIRILGRDNLCHPDAYGTAFMAISRDMLIVQGSVCCTHEEVCEVRR